MDGGLQAGAVMPRLRTRCFGRDYRYFERVESTQTEALAAARAGAGEGTVFVAEAQTAGRGRHGHTWESAAGEGIYCSLLLRPTGAPGWLLPFMLAAGLALADAVEGVCGAVAEIRWPNDLLLGGRKFCGLLVEGGGETLAVLGFGINAGQKSFAPELRHIATSLALEGFAVERAALLAECLRQLERRYERRGHTAETIAEFERRSRYARGLAVRVGEGAESFEGTTAGLDATGFLRVETAGGEMRTVVSGQVRPRV